MKRIYLKRKLCKGGTLKITKKSRKKHFHKYQDKVLNYPFKFRHDTYQIPFVIWSTTGHEPLNERKN